MKLRVIEIMRTKDHNLTHWVININRERIWTEWTAYSTTTGKGNGQIMILETHYYSCVYTYI